MRRRFILKPLILAASASLAGCSMRGAPSAPYPLAPAPVATPASARQPDEPPGWFVDLMDILGGGRGTSGTGASPQADPAEPTPPVSPGPSAEPDVVPEAPSSPGTQPATGGLIRLEADSVVVKVEAGEIYTTLAGNNPLAGGVMRSRPISMGCDSASDQISVGVRVGDEVRYALPTFATDFAVGFTDSATSWWGSWLAIHAMPLPPGSFRGVDICRGTWLAW